MKSPRIQFKTHQDTHRLFAVVWRYALEIAALDDNGNEGRFRIVRGSDSKEAFRTLGEAKAYIRKWQDRYSAERGERYLIVSNATHQVVWS